MRAERAWVRLSPSGRRLNLLQPDPRAWQHADLAVGLSRTYRWGGHSAWKLPLSVAQHSLTVLAICKASPSSCGNSCMMLMRGSCHSTASHRSSHIWGKVTPVWSNGCRRRSAFVINCRPGPPRLTPGTSGRTAWRRPVKLSMWLAGASMTSATHWKSMQHRSCAIRWLVRVECARGSPGHPSSPRSSSSKNSTA